MDGGNELLAALELQVRNSQTTINDLQIEKERIIGMLNSTIKNANLLKDELAFVKMQTHAVVKALLLRFATGPDDFVIEEEELKKAKFHRLEKGSREGLAPNALSFTIRECTDEERQREEALTTQAKTAEKNIAKAAKKRIIT